MKTAALMGAAVLFATGPAFAGVLQNKDAKPYAYEVFWDDMEAPIKGTIEPGQEVELRDNPCTVSLPTQHDSMYMRPGESIFIRRGILRRPEEKK